MKTKTRSKIYLPMAVLFLKAALALPAAAQTTVPFEGTFQGSDNTSNLPTIVQSVTGIATLVGKFSSTTLLTVGPSGGTGTAQWIAANGDTIDTTVVGSPQPVSMSPCQVEGAQPDDSYVKITEIHTIIGGTGRFAGAQGSFTLILYHDKSMSSPHGTCGSFSGTITPRGEAH